jgi:K+-transporting ATPase KdpF subunit
MTALELSKQTKNSNGGELLVIILGIVVIVMFIYLGYVLVQPEKF